MVLLQTGGPLPLCLSLRSLPPALVWYLALEAWRLLARPQIVFQTPSPALPHPFKGRFCLP